MLALIDQRTKSRLLWLTVAGAAIPLLFLLLNLLLDFEWWHIGAVLWPTGFRMMAASGASVTDLWYWQVFGFSTICNVLIYWCVGFIACWLFIDVIWSKLIKRPNS